MRRGLSLAAFLLISALAAPAAAVDPRDWNACIRPKSADASIAACTRILDSGTGATYERMMAFSSRCWAYSQKFEYSRAAPDCRAAVNLKPDNVPAWNRLGVADYRLGDFDRAIADFDALLQVNPKVSEAFHNRGLVWQDKGEFDKALADLDESIRLDPQDANAYDNRGQVWRDKGDYDRALADEGRAIALQPRAALHRANRGEIWRMKGDLERALQDGDEAVRLDPKSSVARVLRGDIYRYRGEFERALADYDKALDMIPGFVAVFAAKGLTYERMGDPARARAEFEKTLSTPTEEKSNLNKAGIETAQARLAALDSGAALPVIPPVPAKAVSATSIPTPQAAIPAAVAAPRASQGRRVALVIGNSSYSNVPALPNPQRDAAAVAATLRAVGFETVTLETNDTREKLINALRNFANEAERADWAVVYFAGHGLEMGGVNYLIPVDARIATDRDVQFEAIPFDQVMAALDGARKLKLVLLDACRDNPFAPQMRRTPASEAVAASSTAGAAIGTRSIGRGLGEVKVSGATLVVYAAKQGEVALDGDGGNSPFAVAVVQRIATPGVEINKIFRLVRDDVMEATAGRQEPYTYGSLPGSEDFFFVQR
jgi:tetratricopeptide (TPR) repeat protein